MRRTAAVALALAVLPLAPAGAAADPLLATWVVERVSPTAKTLTVRGSAGALGGEHAFAAVASATVGRDGKLSGADGALFFGVVPDSRIQMETPAGRVECKDIPVAATVCAQQMAVGVIAFAVWWSDVTFNRAFVVLRGRSRGIDLGEHGSPGWRLRRWTGPTRVVTDADMASAGTPLGRGAGSFGYASAPAAAGSVAIGKLPCMNAGYTNVGAGAAELRGGIRPVLATCADWYPPAAASRGATEWEFEGAAGGVSDTPARLVVIQERRG